MLNKKRVLATVVVMVMLFAGFSQVSIFEVGADSGHPQKKLFDARWYQQVSGGDYATWMNLSTSQPWLFCGISASDCGSRWFGPLNGAATDWNGQNTTVDLAIQPDQNLNYDINVIVSDLVLDTPGLLGFAPWFDSSYNQCFTCTIWYGWVLVSDLGHTGAYGTANDRQATVSHELGHLFALRHESVNADETVLYECGMDDTGPIPHSIESYNCIDPIAVGGQGEYEVQPWDVCGVNHAYFDPTIGYAGCKSDLTVLSISTDPVSPASGEATEVTITVANTGDTAAGHFYIDFYEDRPSAPGPTEVGDFFCERDSLDAGVSVTCINPSYAFAANGTLQMWAQVDTDQEVAESNEANNVFGPQAIIIAASPGPTPTASPTATPTATASPTATATPSPTVLPATATPSPTAGPDADGDGIPDSTDNCPLWPNPAQNLPPWPIPAGDDDCDGSVTGDANSGEVFFGTDPSDPCSDTATWYDERGSAFGEPEPAWPPDINDDQWANFGDVLAFEPHFNKTFPDPDYSTRFDFLTDGKVSFGDILFAYVPVFNKNCTTYFAP